MTAVTDDAAVPRGTQQARAEMCLNLALPALQDGCRAIQGGRLAPKPLPDQLVLAGNWQHQGGSEPRTKVRRPQGQHRSQRADKGRGVKRAEEKLRREGPGVGVGAGGLQARGSSERGPQDKHLPPHPPAASRAPLSPRPSREQGPLHAVNWRVLSLGLARSLPVPPPSPTPAGQAPQGCLARGNPPAMSSPPIRPGIWA